MRSEKLISYIILMFVLLIAASNSVASLYLLMLEKQKDIRMLSNMGMKSKTAYAIFVVESMLIALVGGGSGILLGSVVCYVQQHYGIVKLNDSPVFLYQYYPVALHWMDILLVFVTVVILGLLTAQYPARKAAQLISLK
jgi:lipoprotein-releasing system permease protein